MSYETNNGPMPEKSAADQMFDASGTLYDATLAQLRQDGERINPCFIDRMEDPLLLQGLADRDGVGIAGVTEYVRHSNRYSNLGRQAIFNGWVTMPESDLYLYPSGNAREEQIGQSLDLDAVRDLGADPSRILYFRVTQPAVQQPKPEYYWTSDFIEVKRGLRHELGHQAATAIILVSTLEKIAENGGLISDINDDSGIAVRQRGHGPFDQRDALLRLKRPV